MQFLLEITEPNISSSEICLFHFLVDFHAFTFTNGPDNGASDHTMEHFTHEQSSSTL